MKYCMSARQPKSTLDKADEIKVLWRDRAVISDFVEDHPDKKIILDVPAGETDFDFNLFQMYKEKLADFELCISDMNLVELFSQLDIKYYWRYPATTFFELRGLVGSGVSEIIIGMPLCFQLDKVKEITQDIPLRMIPNQAYDKYIRRFNGIHGQWVRPEDVEAYEPYITSFEFISDDLGRERAFFSVYAEKKEWPGNLNILINNLDYNVDNRGIPVGLVHSRLNCGQRCEVTGACHLCDQALAFVNSVDRHKGNF